MKPRWDSSVAADQGVVDDEILVAGLRKSRYAALQAGYMANTPDKRLNPMQGHNPVLPSMKIEMSEGGSVAKSDAASSREVNGNGLVLASIVRGVVTASGVGCESVVTSNRSLADQQPCWTTRCHRDHLESYCTLELKRRPHTDVQVKVTFASLDCTAKSVSFAHASAPQMTWEPLGSMALRSHGDSRLQHVIKLGAHTQIQRYLRITLVGLLQTPGSGFHKVVRMRVVAPTPVTERSMGREVSSIPAHYPPGSAASSAANARRAGEAAQQSPPAELPQEPRSMQPVPIAATSGREITLLDAGYANPHWQSLTASGAGTSGSHAPQGQLGPQPASQEEAAQLTARKAPSRPPPPPPKPQGLAAKGMPVAGPKAPPPRPPPPPPGKGANAAPPPPPPPPAKAAPAPQGRGARPPPPPPPPPGKRQGGGGPGAPPPPPPPPPGKRQGGGRPGAPPPPPPPPPGKRQGGGGPAAPPPPPPLPGSKQPAAGPPVPPPAPAAEAPPILPPGKTPSRPTNKIFWDKLDPQQVANTVWGQLEPVDADIDFDQLEDEFASKATAILKGNRDKGPKIKMLLTQQRAQNVSVFLATLRMTPAQIKEAVLQCGTDSEDSLSDDELAGMLQCLPNEEDVKRLSAAPKDVKQLGAAEQFMLAMLSIPQVEQRLQAARFERQFGGREAVARAQVGTLRAACEEVRRNRTLPVLLQISLAAGNFLNWGNRAGGAAGFKIESLLKLKGLKSRLEGRTLLHFVAQELAKKHADKMPIKGSLAAVAAASRLALGPLQAEVADLRRSLAAIQRTLSALPQDDTDSFRQVMSAFHARAGEQVASLEADLSAAVAAFGQLAAYVNGAANASVSDPQAFFTVLITFARDLDIAHKEIISAEKMAARQTEKPEKRGKKPGDPGKLPPLRQRDKMLSHVRAFQRLRPEDRNALLTEKGARDRIRRLGLQQRSSVPSLHAALGAEASAALGVLSGGRLAQEVHAGPSDGGGEASVRASCPIKPMPAGLRLPLSARLHGSDAGVRASLQVLAGQLSARRALARSSRGALTARNLCIPLPATPLHSGSLSARGPLVRASVAAVRASRAMQAGPSPSAPPRGEEDGWKEMTEEEIVAVEVTAAVAGSGTPRQQQPNIGRVLSPVPENDAAKMRRSRDVVAESRRNGNSSSEAAVPGSGFAEQSGNPNAISGAFAGSQELFLSGMQRATTGHQDDASVSSTPMNPLCSPAGDATASSCTSAPAARRIPAMPAPGPTGQQSSSQHFPQATPVPMPDLTPQDWPEGPRQSQHAATNEPYLHPVSLFDQLGPHPMQSLTQLPPKQQPTRAAAHSDVRASLTARHVSRADQSRSASISATGSSDGSHDSPGAEEASTRWPAPPQQQHQEIPEDVHCGANGRSDTWVGGGTAPIGRASIKALPGGGGGGNVNGEAAVRRSLLPPVLPKYQTSPLRTPKLGTLHASHALARPAAQLATWRRSANSTAAVAGLSSADAAPVAAAARPGALVVPGYADAAASATALSAAGPAVVGDSPGQVGALERRHSGDGFQQFSHNVGDYIAEGMAVGGSGQLATAGNQRMVCSISGAQDWRKGEPQAQAFRRSAPYAVHRYADVGSLESEDGSSNDENDAERVPGSASEGEGPRSERQQLAHESTSLASSRASEEVGHFESNAAADGAAPSPFSPDMGLLLQPLPTPAPPSFGFAGERGTTPETPTLVAAPKEAGQELRPVPGERSPQPKGQRPRSAQRQVESHPLHISSDESFETELGPLGRSMEAGPLKQELGIKQDSALKAAFSRMGEAGHLRGSCALISSMHLSPGPLGRSVNVAPAAPQRPGRTHMAEVTNLRLDGRREQLPAPVSQTGHGGVGSKLQATPQSGITPLLERQRQALDAAAAAELDGLADKEAQDLTGDIDERLCLQPLRDSLQMHSRLGAAAAAARLLASIAHPPASDWPGPLEAGHRRARSLILTPECKKGACFHPRPAAVAEAAPSVRSSAAFVPADDDLMTFTPEPINLPGPGKGGIDARREQDAGGKGKISKTVDGGNRLSTPQAAGKAREKNAQRTPMWWGSLLRRQRN